MDSKKSLIHAIIKHLRYCWWVCQLSSWWL